MTKADANAPVLIELPDAAEAPSPETAPPVPEGEEGQGAPLPPGQSSRGRAMRGAAGWAARRGSALGRWAWRLFLALAGFFLSLWAWDALNALLARNPVLGWIAIGLVAAFLVLCLGIVLREWAAFVRLGRIDELRRASERAIAGHDLAAARAAAGKLQRLYRHRPEAQWGLARFAERVEEQFDADALLALAEAEILSPLDEAAREAVEGAARQVAVVTAIVPLALADVVAALTANLRMIRRIAEIYGGRAGILGSWRLTRAVLGHLVATGAVAVGDDLLGSIAGGGVLSKISRRFGEGTINGALTARVGVAAIELCRPLSFRARKRPSVSGIVQRALSGLFGNRSARAAAPDQPAEE